MSGTSDRKQSDSIASILHGDHFTAIELGAAVRYHRREAGDDVDDLDADSHVCQEAQAQS